MGSAYLAAYVRRSSIISVLCGFVILIDVVEDSQAGVDLVLHRFQLNTHLEGGCSLLQVSVKRIYFALARALLSDFNVR